MTILERIIEAYPDEELLSADGLDEAVIAIEPNSMRLVYSITKIIDILVAEGLTDEEAMEHFDFNIGGAYVGEKTPIYVLDRWR